MEEKELKNAPIENFDWEAYEKGKTFGEKSHEELEKTYDQTLSTVKDKDVTEGMVISMNKREVVVNIGYKSDGIISMS
ncbi:MAG: 30S ribosomal protein S1, partial [Bacteroidales bacterium]